MKNITISLNEEQHKTLVNKASEFELSEYALTKKILLNYLNSDVPNSLDDAARPYVNKIKTLKRKQKWALATIFVLVCYFGVSLAYILLF